MGRLLYGAVIALVALAIVAAILGYMVDAGHEARRDCIEYGACDPALP